MEQSYLPILIKNNGYDSICHEHLTYFTLKQINYLCDQNNLRVFKVSLNPMYGGSIRVFICHKYAKFKIDFSSIQKCNRLEKKYINSKKFLYFKKNIQLLSKKLNNMIKKIEIETGVRNQGNLEVLKGLIQGDKIIAEGLTKVRPGMKVKPIIKSQ